MDGDVDHREAFRRNLQSFRMQRGFTQSELSTRANFDATYVGKLERGESSPSMNAILRLSRVLGIRPVDLLSPPRSHLTINPGLPAEELGDIPFNPLEVQIFDNLPFPMGLATDRGSIVYLNDAFVEQAGISLEDIGDARMWELPFWNFSGRSPDGLIDAVRNIREVEVYLHYVLRIPSEDDNAMHLYLYPVPRNERERDRAMALFEFRHLGSPTIPFPLAVEDYEQSP